MLEGTGIGATRGGRQLFDNLDVRIKRLDRLAIVGPNGAGKSTLLKILAGLRSDGDRGEVRLGTNIDVGYFDQHLESLNPALSCIEVVRELRPDMVVDAVRQYLARFRFYGDDSFRAVASLSGGERTRLALAKLLLVSRNFLLLDEPTNHLDLPSCEILEEALAHFDGTVVLVSHDRYFLERVATRVLHLENSVLTQYSGTWSDYVSHQRKLADALAQAAGPSAESRASVSEKAEKNKGRDGYQEQKRLAREQEKRARRVSELEALIAKGEGQIAELRTKLSSAPGGDWEKIAELADQEQALVRQIDGWTDEWMRISE